MCFSQGDRNDSSFGEPDRCVRGEGAAREEAACPRSAEERAETLFNRMTLNHVVLGFMAYRESLRSPTAPAQRWHALTRSEAIALEIWQEQHDAGELPTEPFAALVEAVARDPAPNLAFVGFNMLGSIVRRLPRDTMTDLLQLSVTQEHDARAIYFNLHKAIRDKRHQTHSRIRQEVGAAPEDLAAALNDARRPVATRRPARMLETLVEVLGITGDRQANLVGQCALLRRGVQGLHAVARNQFIGLLTGSQREILESIEKLPPRAQR